MLKKATISAAIEHLSEGEIDRFEEEQIKNIYEISDIEVNKVYRIWRDKYLNKNLK
ncbi:hypothetical protein [Clostridium sp. D53t1_180928_C8]|uniref:hypothetical protein n=1 Tax=Clostridium sp. D53t1_180928_C8 TaxID=2787101 RepID=UPI0018ABF6E7|nr:hypothetical protein [Clostridium sp. D53t1_180928_C8]